MKKRTSRQDIIEVAIAVDEYLFDDFRLAVSIEEGTPGRWQDVVRNFMQLYVRDVIGIVDADDLKSDSDLR